jgi:outer membrane protein
MRSLRTRGFPCKGLFLLVVAIAVSGNVAVGEPTEAVTTVDSQVLTLTLEEALARARSVSPRLAELESLEQAAVAELRRAEAGHQPDLSLSAYYQRYADVPELFTVRPGEGLLAIFPNIPDNYGAKVGFELPVYAGGRIGGGIEAAEWRQQAVESDSQSGVANLDLEVTVAFWQLVVMRERQAVLARGIAAFEAHLADAHNRQEYGLAAANEVLAVEVERDRAELERLRAAHQAQIAQAELARLLALPLGTTIEPEPYFAPGPEQVSQSAAALVEEALAARTERRALAARVAAAESRVRIERGDRRPEVGARGEFLYARPNRNIPPFEDEFQDWWQVGINARWSFFDGGRQAADVARAEAEVEALRWRLEDLDRALRLEVETRLVDLTTAHAAVRVSETAVASARENVKVTADRYREGLIPSSERLDAETALLQAELEQTTALVSTRIAEAHLDRALGR